MNNINNLDKCISLIEYLRAEPLKDSNNPAGGVGVLGKKRKKLQCTPPKIFIKPTSTLAKTTLLARNLATIPLSPSLPLGYPLSSNITPFNRFSRKPETAPLASTYQPRHQAFLLASQTAQRSAKRLLNHIRLYGSNDREVAFLTATLITNTLALGSFFK